MKPRPINIKIEAERMQRDAAARWLDRHDKTSAAQAKKTAPQQACKQKGGARR